MVICIGLMVNLVVISVQLADVSRMVTLRDEYLTQQRLIINKVSSIESRLELPELEEVVIPSSRLERKVKPALTPELPESEVPYEEAFDRS